MSKFFAILTHAGADKIANATVLGTQIKITQMAVGDGNGTLPVPDPAQTKLVHEVRRGAINQLFIDEKNTNQIIAEQVIPENEGGWWIREIGLYDEDGILIAVGNCPETYKPQLQEGSGRAQTLRMILVVSSTEAVTLKVDPSVVLATKSYVIELVDKKLKEHEQSRNHPSATLKEKGLVRLNSATNSDSETEAATPKAVKAAYGLAESASKEANKKIDKTSVIHKIEQSEDKVTSGLAVDLALKEQDPRQWGIGRSYAPRMTTEMIEGKAPTGVYRVESEDAAASEEMPIKAGVVFHAAYADFEYRQVSLAIHHTTSQAFVRGTGGGREWYELYSTKNTSIDPNGVLTTKQDTVTLTTDDLAKETGNSHSKVMTQKAVSDLVLTHGLGYGQKWYDVKESRKFGVTYTNDTNKPILILLSLMTASGANIKISVNGVEVASLSSDSATRTASDVLIPAGHTYIVTASSGTPSLSNWSELK